MKIFCLTTTLLLSHFGFSQTRLEIQMCTGFSNLQFGLNVHQLLGNNWLLSGGISGGGALKSWIDNDRAELEQGLEVNSPYATANRDISQDGENYELLDYAHAPRFIGAQFGPGYFHEFDVQHGIRVNTYFILNYVSNNFTGYYYSRNQNLEIYKNTIFQHFVGGASAEVAHTIRLTGKTTFCYGLKLPYYFSVDKARFNPLNQKDLLYGFEPQLHLSITHLIGKCPDKVSARD